MNLFIENLVSDNPADRFYFLAVVLTVVVSIVLHELAHGWAAIYLGDNTPRRLNRMTGNPLVHMGPFSIIALLVAGLAWGQMPIDHTRMRGRYAEAIVAGAGPAMNLLIAIVTLTAMAGLSVLWNVAWMPPGNALVGYFEYSGLSLLQQNALRLCAIAGTTNLLLLFFNLLPAPPLDGSHILANFNRRYALFIEDPKNYGVMMLLFIFCFAVGSQMLSRWAVQSMIFYVELILTPWQ